MGYDNEIIQEYINAWQDLAAYYQQGKPGSPNSGDIFACIAFVEHLHDLAHTPNIDDHTREQVVELRSTIRAVLLDILNIGGAPG